MTKINPRDLKPGQRVRVTFEADFVAADGPDILPIILSMPSLPDDFRRGSYPIEGFEYVALPDPIKVGDRVKHDMCGCGTVIALHDGDAWVARDAERHAVTWPIQHITKVEASA